MAIVEMGCQTLIKRADDCYIVNFLKEESYNVLLSSLTTLNPTFTRYDINPILKKYK
jgi:hypothetical protein